MHPARTRLASAHSREDRREVAAVARHEDATIRRSEREHRRVSRVMTRAPNKRPSARRRAQEDDAQLVGGTRRPEAREIPAQFMHAQRWVALVLIEEAQGLEKAALVLFSESGERLEELGGEIEGPVGFRYGRDFRGRRFAARRGNRPPSRSSSLNR